MNHSSAKIVPFRTSFYNLQYKLIFLGVKYVAGGSSFLGAFFNCWVHVLMYTYYALGRYSKLTQLVYMKKYSADPAEQSKIIGESN